VNNSLGLSSMRATRTTRSIKERKKWTTNGKDFINNFPWGEEQRHDRAYPAGANYIPKEGRRLAPLPRRLLRQAAPLLRCGLGVGAANASGSEDPHRGL
jgi:hypothetical protein